MNPVKIGTAVLYCGDCREILPTLGRFFSSCVTDPPYEIGFLGHEWDKAGVSFNSSTWRVLLDAALPGAYLLSFGGTRTFHRIACAIEDAGWKLRDTIMWVYSQGFPKGRQNVALKPAWEPILVAHKLLEGSIAENFSRYGTGLMNINGCRVKTKDKLSTHSRGRGYSGSAFGRQNPMPTRVQPGQLLGRWPANLVHDGSKEVTRLFPGSGGDSAARFFFCLKASRAERTQGGASNKHPTVKPLALMKWLCTLVGLPQDGVILDPFMGSGTTGVAAILAGQTFIGIEQNEQSFDDAKRRIAWALEQKGA